MEEKVTQREVATQKAKATTWVVLFTTAIILAVVTQDELFWGATMVLFGVVMLSNRKLQRIYYAHQVGMLRQKGRNRYALYTDEGFRF